MSLETFLSKFQIFSLKWNHQTKKFTSSLQNTQLMVFKKLDHLCKCIEVIKMTFEPGSIDEVSF